MTGTGRRAGASARPTSCASWRRSIAPRRARSGLYSSNVGRWRQQRDHGVLQGLAPTKLGSRQALANPLKPVIDRLERENAHLCKRLVRAEAVIDIQRKSL